MILSKYTLASQNYEKSLDSDLKKNNGIFYTDIKKRCQKASFLFFIKTT